METLSNTLCPECENSLEHKHITHDVRFQGGLYSFQDVPATICAGCGAVYLDAKVLKQIEAVFRKHIQPQEYQKVPTFAFNTLTA